MTREDFDKLPIWDGALNIDPNDPRCGVIQGDLAFIVVGKVRGTLVKVGGLKRLHVDGEGDLA